MADGIQKRMQNTLKNQSNRRLLMVDHMRNLQRNPFPTLSEAQQRPDQKLEIWKAKKLKEKAAAFQKMRPAFIVGVLHPPPYYVPPPQFKKTRTTNCAASSQSAQFKKVTEEPTLYKSFAPPNAPFKPRLRCEKNQTNTTLDPVQLNTLNPINEVKQTRSRTTYKPVQARITRSTANDTKTTNKTKPLLKTNLRNETDSLPSSSRQPQPSIKSSNQSTIIKKLPTVMNKTKKSLPESSVVSKTPQKSTQKKQHTPKNRVPTSDTSSEKHLMSPKSLTDVLMIPEQMANKIKKCETMLPGKDSVRGEVKKKLDKGMPDEDTSDIIHFRRQLASEIQRMTEMCDSWGRVLEQTVLPVSVQECVLGAVGQARLLMSQKLQQFAKLVEKCARPKPGDMLVTTTDLQGFWDMVYMQVENVDMRFQKLDAMRARDWLEDEPVVVAKKTDPVKVDKKLVAGVSKIKHLIAAARNAKKDQNQGQTEKTFQAGFFVVNSPVRCDDDGDSTHQFKKPPSKPIQLKPSLDSEPEKSTSRESASVAMRRIALLEKDTKSEEVLPLHVEPRRSSRKLKRQNAQDEATDHDYQQQDDEDMMI